MMFAIKVDSNGWIRDVSQKPSLPRGWKEVDQSTYDKVDSADPTQEQKAWHWNSGEPELRETGASPSGDEAYAKMEAYLRDKYTLNEMADLLDNNGTLIDFITREAFEDAVKRADYLADDSNSLIDQEDADKLREVTKV